MIILDTLLMLGGLLFAIFAYTKHMTYDTNNDNTDKLIITLLWFGVFIDNLVDVLKHFNL